MSSLGVSITGTGVFHPEQSVTNEELCIAFNKFVALFNAENAKAIERGEVAALRESSPEFIEKASGIKSRYVADKSGLLDPERMMPYLPERPDEELCIQAEFGVAAAERALQAAGRCGEDVDMIIHATSNLQRMYPSLGIEVQNALGASGFAYDVTVGCSSVTFAIQIAADALRSGSATCALLVNPELMTGHANWRDRDSHFLFGDAATAVVVEPSKHARPGSFEIVSTRLLSKFSSNIRNNSGYLNRCDMEHRDDPDKLFYQQGRRVYKDVIPLASAFIESHLESADLTPSKVARFWLHQANSNMNNSIAKRLLGRSATQSEAPLILDTYGNTASCGSIIAFNKHHDDLPSGSYGLLSSFGAGYSIGSVLLRRSAL